MRVAFLTNIVSPYRLPVFKCLADTPGWQFRVFVNADSEFDRSWEVDTGALDVCRTKTWSVRRTVHSSEPIAFKQQITLHLPRSLWFDLRKMKPDVVISHELGPRTMLAAAYCKAHNIPLVIWAYQSRISGSQTNKFKDFVRRSLLSSAAMVVGMGTQAREVLSGLGVEQDRILDAPNASDRDTFTQRLMEPDTDNQVQRLRDQIGKGRRLACVYGRLVPLKGIAELLAHWRSLPASVKDQWRLVFVGEGPLAELIRQERDPSLHYAGGVPAEQMAAWYRAADLHVFPSLGDVWGLVVNEAMQCGVPTLCSLHAGCCEDLIRDGVDGFVYDPTSSDAVSKLERALTHRDLHSMGQKANRVAESFTASRMAEAFRLAVSRSLDQAAFGVVAS